MPSPRSLLVPVNQQSIRQWNAFLLFLIVLSWDLWEQDNHFQNTDQMVELLVLDCQSWWNFDWKLFTGTQTRLSLPGMENQMPWSLERTLGNIKEHCRTEKSVCWGFSLVEHCMQEQFLVKWHEESWLGLPVQSWSLVYLTGTWNHWILVLKGSKIAEIPVKTVNVRAKYTLGLVDPVLGCSAWVEASRDTVVP